MIHAGAKGLVRAERVIVPKGATTTRFAWDLALVVLPGTIDRDDAELALP